MKIRTTNNAVAFAESDPAVDLFDAEGCGEGTEVGHDARRHDYIASQIVIPAKSMGSNCNIDLAVD